MTGLIVGGFAVIVMLGILAAAETALNKMGIHRVQRSLLGTTNSNGDKTEEPWTLQDHSMVLTSLQVARVLMLLFLGFLLAFVATQITEDITLEVLTLSAGALLLLVVEVSARQVASAHSTVVANRTLPLGLAMSRLLYPLVLLLTFVSRPLTGKGEERADPLGVSLENIHQEILVLQNQGVIERDESELIQSVFEFGETIAKEVMVPRVDMVCVEMGSPLSRVLELMIQSGFTRLPVYEDDVDNILGLVHAKDLLRKLDGSGTHDLKASLTRGELREVLIVPGTKKIPKILRELQKDKITMAIVVDEYGGTDGLMTLEDIVEEIVGEITDEYDQATEGIQMHRDGSSVVDAKMVLEDVNQVLNLDLPVDEHETLGGYVYGLFGRVPKAGEKASVDGLEITVESTHRQRITRVRICNLEHIAVPQPELASVE